MTGLVMMPRVVPATLTDVKDSIEASGGVSRAYRYCHGNGKPHFALPAIPLRVVWWDGGIADGYMDMVYIDNVQDPDDPRMVCAWDFFDGPNCIGKRGQYTRTGE